MNYISELNKGKYIITDDFPARSVIVALELLPPFAKTSTDTKNPYATKTAVIA